MKLIIEIEDAMWLHWILRWLIEELIFTAEEYPARIRKLRLLMF